MAMPELGLFAFAIAGLTASPHCALMCGPVQALQLRGTRPGGALRRSILLVHAGRIAGYALLGAAVAGGGLLLFRRLPDAALGVPLQALAALILLVLGWRQLHPAHGSCCHRAAAPRHPFLRGLGWALLPCGALYAMLFLAMLSRDPAYAALLMAAFGLGTVPLLGAGGGLLHRAGLGSGRLRRVAAAMLIAVGSAGLAMALAGAQAASPALCLIP